MKHHPYLEWCVQIVVIDVRSYFDQQLVGSLGLLAVNLRGLLGFDDGDSSLCLQPYFAHLICPFLCQGRGSPLVGSCNVAAATLHDAVRRLAPLFLGTISSSLARVSSCSGQNLE